MDRQACHFASGVSAYGHIHTSARRWAGDLRQEKTEYRAVLFPRAYFPAAKFRAYFGFLPVSVDIITIRHNIIANRKNEPLGGKFTDRDIYTPVPVLKKNP